jgi:hypothetical protein
MSRLDDRRLAELLRGPQTPEPPPELLAALRRDIPETLPRPAVAPDGKVLPFRSTTKVRRFLVMAASVVMVFGGGMLAWRVLREAPALTAERDQAASAPRPAAPAEDAAADLRRSGETAIAGGAESDTAAEADRFTAKEMDALGYVTDGTAATAPSAAPDAGSVGSAVEKPAEPTGEQPVEGQAVGISGGIAGGMATGVGPVARDRPEETSRGGDREVASYEELEGADSAPADTTPSRDELAESAPSRVGGIAGAAEPRAMEPAAPSSPRPQQPPAAAGRRAADPAPVQAPMPQTAPAPPPPPSVTRAPAPAAGEAEAEEARRDAAPSGVLARGGQPLSVFGAPGGDDTWDNVRRSLDAGQLPPRASVDVERLVDAFDYGDRAATPGEVVLVAEGSRVPWASGLHLLRVGVAAGRPTGGASGQEVARGANVQVAFDPRYVRLARRVGFSGSAPSAGADLASGESATALWEVQLQPDTPPHATVAVVTVRWRPAAGGGPAVSEEEVLAGALDPQWSDARRSVRLAAVAARFGELLRGTPDRGGDLSELAEHAAALAREWPEQPRVAELATLIARARDLRAGSR